MGKLIPQPGTSAASVIVLSLAITIQDEQTGLLWVLEFFIINNSINRE